MRLIKLWPGYLVKQMSKMVTAVDKKNPLDTSVGRKWSVFTFTSNKFWKYVVCILLAVTFGVKIHYIRAKPEESISNKGIAPLRTPLHRYVCGKKYLLKVRCYL